MSVNSEPHRRVRRQGPVTLRGKQIPATTTDQRLLDRRGPADWVHTDPWRVMRIQAEFVEGFGLLAELGPPAGGHVHCDLVMGVPGGMPGNAATLVQAVAALPTGATWSATGIGRTTVPVLFAALAAGGHLRVGMEDTITYAKGQPVESNAQLVARAAAFARLAQRPPMTPAEVRALLGVRS